MKIAIFGSTGMGGRAVLPKLLARGHEATLLMRSHPRPDGLPQGVRVVPGDARDAAAVGDTLTGVDAVIQYLGVGGLGDGRPNDLVPDATRVILDQMAQRGVSRLVCASNVGVPGSGAVFLSKVLVPIAARKLIPILKAKIRMEAMLRDSSADWTAVRLPALTEKPERGRIRVSAEGKSQGFTVTTGDAADFMLDIIEKRQFLRAAVSIAN